MNKYSLVGLPWTPKKPESEVENGGKGDTKVMLSATEQVQGKGRSRIQFIPRFLA